MHRIVIEIEGTDRAAITKASFAIEEALQETLDGRSVVSLPGDHKTGTISARNGQATVRWTVDEFAR